MAFKCVLSILNIALQFIQPTHAAQLQGCSIELCSKQPLSSWGWMAVSSLPQLTDHTSSSRSEQGRSCYLRLVLTS